jgi:hypothetical protein
MRNWDCNATTLLSHFNGIIADIYNYQDKIELHAEDSASPS